MKHSLFSAKIIHLDKNNECSIFAHKGKALVRGIFIEACFNKKEIIR